jgi:hypothetical protein
MSIELSKLTEKLHQKCVDLTPEKEGQLKDLVNLGNTYVELVTFYIDKHSKEDQDVLQTVTDEFFLDIHVSITLAAGGYFKSGCVTLRAAIEIGIYILFFIDHPVELRMWASSGESERDHDMYFLKTLEKLADVNYLEAASKCSVDPEKIIEAKSGLTNCYRLLSERVHGKYKFLQASPDQSADIFANFCMAAEGALKNLIIIGLQRCESPTEVKKKIPSLEKIL